MAANNALRITSINFDDIKENLKSFLSNQTELDDYDYESSTMQTILNLLAYNTYMNSFYLNMVGNEMFLDSAQLRESVVSRAKMLGYTPRSARGATAVVDVTVVPDDTPDSITIAANTSFRSTIDGQSYLFTTRDSYTINANSSGVYSGRINITEGTPLTFRYNVNTRNPSRYIIPNENADLSTLTVKVQASASNSSIQTYTRSTDLINVTSNTFTYFVDEIEENNYELHFGDNVLGRQLTDGNIVIIDYNVVNGKEVNGANTFTLLESIDGYSNVTLNTKERARGGDDYESTESIKFSAPKGYTSQNRAVTANDYKSLILNNFGDIQTVSVWGGEENSPPIYGRSYVSAKPKSALILSSAQKESIAAFLKTRAVLTIDPIIVDPTYLYIKPTILVKYDSTKTSATGGVLGDQVSTKLLNYEQTQLGLFSTPYINSELIKSIDSVNDAITSVDIQVEAVRRFIPILGTSTTYTFAFNRPLLNISGGIVLNISPVRHPGVGLTVSSSAFTYQGQRCFFDDDAFGNIRIYRLNSENRRIYLNRLAGTVNYETGLVKINNLLISAYEGSYIDIRVVPRKFDITPVRNQILQLTSAKVTVFDDTVGKNVAVLNNIATSGDAGEVFEYGVVYSVF